MDALLSLSESNSKYPKHFQDFLNNFVNKFKENFRANDYLFAAVYFLIVETGFTPLDLSDTIEHHDSENFDIRKLRSLKSYSEEQEEKMKKWKRPKSFVYQITFKLGNSRCKCELQGVPSAEIDNHLVINFLLENPHVIKSICLSTEMYTEKIENDEFHKVRLKNLKELSLVIKNKISVHIKNLILMNEGKGCYANLYCIPEFLQKKIIYFLCGDPESVQYLGSTCSYFYNIIASDSKLWEIICFKNYSGQKLNDAILEATSEDSLYSNDENNQLFRRAFFKLKKQEMKKKYRREYVSDREYSFESGPHWL